MDTSAAQPAADRAGVRRADRTLYAMRALGRDDLPATFVIGGVTYRHAKTVKHDFFAATGFYVDDAGRKAVLKMGRTAEYGGVPLDWVGRWLCRREMRFYRALADLPNVPAILGPVGKTGFAHAYVEGRPLAKGMAVPDGFFAQLSALFDEVHRRGIAYVDTNKSPNILLGDDGKPYLIDFQISWDLHDLGDNPLNRWWLARLQREDRYHLLKHKRRLRPDEMTAAEMAGARRPSPLIRLHRWVTRPYFKIRRRTFSRLRDSGRLMPEGSA